MKMSNLKEKFQNNKTNLILKYKIKKYNYFDL